MGADRRKVERHLIACAGCRQHERSLVGALSVLHAAAAQALAAGGDEAPSLWPALARQIRESRHEPASRLDDLARFLLPPARFRPALALAAVLTIAGVAVAWFQAGARPNGSPSTDVRVVETPPASSVDSEEFDPYPSSPPTVPTAAVVVKPSTSMATSKPLVRDDAPLAPLDRTVSRFDYDLDHGTPMGPDSHDVKASY